MNLLIKNVKVVDSQSPFNRKKVNILIENRKIKEIAETKISGLVWLNKTKREDQEIDANGLCISPGWFDMRADFGDPGFEQKEDIHTGSMAAMKGGFTSVALIPETNPLIQTKDVATYVINKAEKSKINLFPYGALTTDRKGKQLTEMMDMNQYGVLGFTEGNLPISDSGVLLRALLYSRHFNGLIIEHAEDKNLSAYGTVNEGKISTLTGLKGIPHLAEEIIILRDLEILKYTGGKLHFSHLSSGRSVSLIRKAKKAGLQVSCDIAAHQIAIDDTQLETFDTRYKLKPPLRTQLDIKEIISGLEDGTIDCIVSDHSPQEPEAKEMEFDLASFGGSFIETAFACAYTILKKYLTLEQIVEKFTIAPRKVLCLPELKIDKDTSAELTLFDPGESYKVKGMDFLSKCKITPLEGMELFGRVKYVINKGVVISF